MEPNILRDDYATMAARLNQLEEESLLGEILLNLELARSKNFSLQEPEKRALKRLVNQQMILNREIASQQAKLLTLETE